MESLLLPFPAPRGEKPRKSVTKVGIAVVAVATLSIVIVDSLTAVQAQGKSSGMKFCQFIKKAGDKEGSKVCKEQVHASANSSAQGDSSDVDLTGTWVGTQVCDELLGGEYVNFVATKDRVLVIQEGDRLRFSNLSLVYEGVIQEVQGSDFVEAVAGVCGGDYEAQEIIRLRRIFTSGGEHGKGHFDAESVFFTDDFPETRGVLEFDTCKWLYDRVSQEPPDVPECEFLGIQPTHE